MTLKRSIGIKLLGGVLAVLLLAQAVQFLEAKRSNRNLGSSSENLLQERELQNVKNIHAALDFGLNDCLSRGDMDVFGRLMKLQQDVPGFAEFSLYNQKGRVSDSSDKALVGHLLEPALKDRLFGSPERLVRTTTNSIEIFKPEIATAKCLECHEDYQAGAVCGVSYFRFSNDASAKLATQFAQIAAAANHRWQGLSVGVLLVGAWLVIGLTLAITSPILKTLTAIARGLDSQGAAVGVAADEVAEASQTLAQSASEQAASLEETSAALTEMAAMTQQNLENIQKVNELAGRARAAADHGVAHVKVMGRAMVELKGSSDQIGKIIKTIDELAFQTNLLALNAAVEAARAGEAGLGFAVVAEEVRNLAQRSARAARETAAKIETTIEKTALSVSTGEMVAAELGQILSEVRRVDELVAQVTTASREQSEGIKQLESTVSALDTVTQSNAASAEEAAGAAQGLNAQTQAFKATINDLGTLINGSTSIIHAETAHMERTGQTAHRPTGERDRPRSEGTPASGRKPSAIQVSSI